MAFLYGNVKVKVNVVFLTCAILFGVFGVLFYAQPCKLVFRGCLKQGRTNVSH